MKMSSSASATGRPATTNAAATGSGSMASGMSMGPAETKAERVDGITPIPTRGWARRTGRG